MAAININFVTGRRRTCEAHLGRAGLHLEGVGLRSSGKKNSSDFRNSDSPDFRRRNPDTIAIVIVTTPAQVPSQSGDQLRKHQFVSGIKIGSISGRSLFGFDT